MPSKLSDYDILSEIGSGSYGTCKRILRKSDKKVRNRTHISIQRLQLDYVFKLDTNCWRYLVQMECFLPGLFFLPLSLYMFISFTNSLSLTDPGMERTGLW